MANIAQTELEQLVRHYTGRITESKETVVREDGVQTHRSSMQQSFVAKIAERSMAVNNLNLLSDENLPENRKRGEDSRKGR